MSLAFVIRIYHDARSFEFRTTSSVQRSPLSVQTVVIASSLTEATGSSPLDAGISEIEICYFCFAHRPPVVCVTKPKRLFICEYCHRIFITNSRMMRPLGMYTRREGADP